MAGKRIVGEVPITIEKDDGIYLGVRLGSGEASSGTVQLSLCGKHLEFSFRPVEGESQTFRVNLDDMAQAIWGAHSGGQLVDPGRC